MVIFKALHDLSKRDVQIKIDILTMCHDLSQKKGQKQSGYSQKLT